MRKGMPLGLLLVGLLSTQSVLGQSAQEEEAKRSKARWNRVFKETENSLDWRVNAFLAESIAGLKPGAALDIGMGQGRNALHLAQEGWRVTGIDISDEAVEQALRESRERGLNLDALVVDALRFDYGDSEWDLVVGMYMHGLITSKADEIVAALKPGGLLIVEGFHVDLNRNGINGRPLGYESNELLRAFGRLRVLYYEEVEDKADWGRTKGRSPLVRFIARKPREKRSSGTR